MSIQRQKISVWARLCGNGAVLGPLFYEGNLNSETYLQMLNTSIIPAIQTVYGIRFERVWLMQDGAPPHRRIIVRDKLREAFVGRVLALGFPTEWPPRSPDLTPCDFFLWGYVKDRVFRSPPPSLEALRQRIEQEFNALKEDPGMVRRAMADMRRRANTCVQRNGRHVEGY